MIQAPLTCAQLTALQWAIDRDIISDIDDEAQLLLPLSAVDVAVMLMRYHDFAANELDGFSPFPSSPGGTQ